MARVPVIPLIIVAAAAALTTRIDTVFAAGEALAPVASTTVPAAETRVGAALATELDKQARQAGRARTADMESALLQATEKRIDEKLERLQGQRPARRALERPVRRIVANPGETGPANVDDRIAGLVTMYQAMRPKDAARIFERLSMNVQVEVASAMRERAMASILAEMDPKAAGDLTMALAGYAPRPAEPDAL